MKKLLLLSPLFLLPGLAVAADLPQVEYIDEQQFNSRWEGGYVGVQAGWNWLHMKDDTSTPDLHVDGGSVGAYAGYNYAWSNVVLGAEADVNIIDIRGITSDRFGRVKSGWSAGLSARLGYDLDLFLPYIRAGVGLQNANAKGYPSLIDDDNTHIYYEIGGGIEAMIAENVSVRAEALYRNASEKTYRLAQDIKGKFDQTIARVGVAYHF